MTQTFYNHMAIPQKCLLDKPIFKRFFHENKALNSIDKKTLKDDILKIRWMYTIKPSTVNIAIYSDDEREYDEVAIIQIDLSSPKHSQRIAEFVNRAIPYPIVLVFSFSGTIAVGVVDKRINQADASKWVIDEPWITEWFDPDAPSDFEQQFMRDMSMEKLSFLNFHAFYRDIQSRVLALITALRSSCYQVTSTEQTESRSKNLEKILKLERECDKLRSEIKKELRFNKKLELNVAMKEYHGIIKKLEQDL